MSKALGTFRAVYLVALCCVGSFLFAYDTGIVGGILTFPSFRRDFRYEEKDRATVGSNSTSLLQAGVAPNTSLFNHAHGAANGFSRMNDGYVSTTSSIDVAMGWIRDHHGGDGYVYAIAAGMNFIDVRETLLHHNPHPYEYELAAHGGLRRIAASIPSTFALGPANVSIPLVEALSSTLDSALSLATRGAKALFALLIISALATGTSVVASTLTVILAPRRWLVRTNLLASVLGGLSLPLSATVTTGLILIGSSALKEVGVGVGLEIRRGGGFLGQWR
ncbi:Heat-labile enterotoxin IIB like protein [Verticillium longisporum]|uniref:Heat-labile enterotoxin IIB like protein n=1 Tax=Verticillium longisporum TaxID=100787 RepID=A0A8I3A0V9_VERLO|nr:Heat-labile enterotoxin IIB like protein [Verticillium longisporum]